MTRGIARGGAAVMLVVSTALAVVLMGWTAPTASAQASTGGAKRFGACLAAQKTGDLLLLFDESSSLQQSDPEGARVQAARYLLQTLGRYAGRVDADLEVATAGFSDTYVPEHDWTRLTDANADATAQQLSGLESKNTGIDTDYWVALDGARQALAAHAKNAEGGQRCQAIAWFSDGKIDFTARKVAKPYAEGVDLSSPEGVEQAGQRAIESICRSGGVADQVRSSGIVMLGIGLGATTAPADFDVMSAISTGKGLAGKTCGVKTDPVPGDFYSVADIDDMLFAFDALNPDPGIENQGAVCQLQVCPEAKHNFVLDRSIKSVTILGSGDVPGVVPYLVSPSGQTVELPRKDGSVDIDVAGVRVSYEWLSETGQNIVMQNTGGAEWAGQWGIVYVDTAGKHPDAVSKVSIHITTDIFPALISSDGKQGHDITWHSGQKLEGLTFGLVDGQNKPVTPTDLAGSATLSAQLVPAGAAPIELLGGVPKEDIGKPVQVDLSNVEPGPATLKMSLVITTAPAVDPAGAQIAPGTQLSPQNVDVNMQILPKLGLPSPGERIDFGSVQAAEGATASLSITGPGCVWIADSDAVTVEAGPEGIGTPKVTSAANSPGNCLKVQADKTGNLDVTLRTEQDGHGGLSGTVPLHVAALDNPDDSQTVQVPFAASLIKPLSTVNFVLVLIAALLLGPGIPLGLLYLSKWWVSKIPDIPLLAERIRAEVRSDIALRDGEPFAMVDTDLVNPVPGLAGGTRRLSVLGTTLTVVLGRSPFGAGHVSVDAGHLISTGSELPATDGTGLRAVLPLAVHNTWVVLHDPRGPSTDAEVLLLVSGNTDIAAREQLYEEVARRLPEVLNGLRLQAVQAGLASPHDDAGPGPSPFGDTAAGAPAGYDPFADGAPPPAPPMGPGQPGPAQPQRYDSDSFDPFGGGA
ncbi:MULTISPECIES: VWA domain-containing protein [unclassified Mycolicibacterium]|uniref:VWA domain-containing protein n=1 Tax=unclassified Mycolicibacterium TaxID=2636767 RepID=UPI0012DD340B|nr:MULTISPECIES: VWA domain-containing protein [unclassified Mycolicibacterium]MUL85847.1 VWA domain-containing protein [Mycolicibacterium sp. CBMA 329]MUL90217.1 VWA domain-containing protein [Mycolicibacterium sp. CBMA 331]MUM00986.1 VWA domain-containing protein [Mycolicibacterium sp. CBMA 334]MUM27140.1 VWA domain-containing protein [Mycolicibacterium sp. CBMA 295]MUM39732.1 VWA domain-containing protein [Mycolicibacterium sp. CBMA 247]